MQYVRFVVVFVVVLLLAGSVQESTAQIVKRLKQRAKDKIEQNVGEKQDEVIDQVFDGPSSGTAEEQTSTAAGDTPARPVRGGDGRPGEGAWANYDFVPGERVLLAEDFMDDRVGNFPHRFELISGNAEVVEWNGLRWLRMNDETYFKIPLPENLPQRFTIEFDVTVPWWGMDFHSDLRTDRYNENIFATSGVVLNCCVAGVYRGQGDAVSSVDPRDFFKGMFEDRSIAPPMRVRMHVDGSYVKLYLEEKRVANLPNGNFGRQDYLVVRSTGSADESKAPLMTNFSINAGGSPMYDALMAEGRFATQGIFFDTGSDRLRPESTPTLKEIGDMLTRHTDLRVCIEGHTDDVGSDVSNQELSQMRAAAVTGYLVEKFQIDASRLESMGFGESSPMASNDTPEGRQQNRRVEIVKL